MAQPPPNGNQPKVLPPLVPNVGIAVVYRTKMERAIDRMNNSLDYWLTRRWEEDPRAANRIIATMKELGHRWQSNFDELAPDVAGQWGAGAIKHTTARFEKILSDAGWTVNFKVTPEVQAAMNSAVVENVGLIRSIASEHLQRVEGVVMRNVQKGNDLNSMTRELHDQFDVPLKRAKLIARDQTFKMNSVISRARQTQFGIKRAKWMHSNIRTPGHFRPEHLAFSDGRHSDGPSGTGPYYQVDRGAYLEGRWTYPGFEINCRCSSRGVIEGFE